MNFDFMKDLKGLGLAYDSCKDAEELATTKPYLSMTASRKSAELLARFIYMASHSQQMEELTFAEILRDVTVKRFVHNWDVMDAFHYIRKSGNKAVHGDDDELPEDAIDVLHDLHFVAGETACMLGLIDDYPVFEEKIENYPKAEYREEDIIAKAEEMFCAYIEEYNAQIERDKYEELSLTERQEEVFQIGLTNCIEMHEYVEFKHKPHTAVSEYLERYICYLIRLMLPQLDDNDYNIWLDIVIKTNDKTLSFKEDPEKFAENASEAIRSKEFSIDIFCSGCLAEYCDSDGNGFATYFFTKGDNGDIEWPLVEKESLWNGVGMYDTMQAFKRRENFTYKFSGYYPNSGQYERKKIENGREYDLNSLLSNEILKDEQELFWFTMECLLDISFDMDKYPEILEELRNTVRRHLQDEVEIDYIEKVWEEEPSTIVDNQWCPDKLIEIQDFADEITKVLSPIKDEIKVYTIGNWDDRDKFAFATWKWTEDGLKVVGVKY